MKRVLFSITATILGLVALLSFKSRSGPLSSAGGLPSAATAPSTPAARPPSSTTTSAPPTGAGSSTAGATSTAGAARQYAGSAVQTRYGIVQVAVTVSGRHIDSVKFLQLTAFDQRSQDINSQAGPILLQETLSAQSAQVDTVSGATYTSDGYVQSLQSALDRAGLG